VSPSAVGVGQLAERPGDELAGALLVLEGERDELDVGEPGDAQVGPRYTKRGRSGRPGSVHETATRSRTSNSTTWRHGTTWCSATRS
jgi:hypothetical protein